jgi:hypothetical protein
MPFISATARKNTENGGGNKDYLKIKKEKIGDSIRFAILSEEPLDYWAAWACETATGKFKPFRFVSQPTDADIEAEIGPNFERAKAYRSEEIRPPAFCITMFVWSFEDEKVMVLELDKKTLIREVDAISQQPDYEVIQDTDLIITFKGPDNGWYSVMPAPRKKGTQDQIDAAWTEAQQKGYDLNQLLAGASPFGESNA